MNHEYVERFLHAEMHGVEADRNAFTLNADGSQPRSCSQGNERPWVSIAHIRRDGNRWNLVPDST